MSMTNQKDQKNQRQNYQKQKTGVRGRFGRPWGEWKRNLKRGEGNNEINPSKKAQQKDVDSLNPRMFVNYHKMKSCETGELRKCNSVHKRRRKVGGLETGKWVGHLKPRGRK